MHHNKNLDFITCKLTEFFGAEKAGSLWNYYYDHYIQDIEKDIAAVYEKYCMLENSSVKTLQSYADFLSLTQDRKLIFNKENTVRSIKSLRKIKELFSRKVKSYYQCLKTNTIPAKKINSLFLENSEVFRYYLSELALYRTQLDWRSPSYNTSLYANIFSPKNLDTKKINYARYGDYESSLEKEVSQRWYSGSGFNLRTLATASGMSSYAVVEDFLLKNHIENHDNLLTIPYIYFEAWEQLYKLQLQKHIKIIKAPSYAAADINDYIEKFKPSCIFIDLLTNIGDITVVDVEKVFAYLSVRHKYKNLYVIFDNTMTPSYNPFTDWEKYFNPNNAGGPRLVVYESGNKYRQLGLDLTNAGFITSYEQDYAKLHRSRRNTGQNLSDFSNSVYPRYSNKLFISRMNRLQRNALLICDVINNDKNLGVTANHPLSASNQYRRLARKYQILSGIVTFSLNEDEAKKNYYSNLIGRILRRAKKYSVSLAHGLSFGFDISRISASASMAENTEPFLRLSCGTEDIFNSLLLAECIKDTGIKKLGQ